MTKRVMLTRPTYRGHGVTRASVDPGEQAGLRKDTPHPPPPYREGGRGGALPAAVEVKTLQELLVLANKLPAAEKQQLLDHLALQAQTAPSASERDVDMWSVAIHEALQHALGEAGGALGGPILVKRVVGSPSSWKPVDAFMRASKMADLQVRERQSVYGLLADLLVKHARYVARKSGAPLSPKLVGNCTGSISGVFDAAFPGYLEAGLAPIVARRLTSAAR